MELNQKHLDFNTYCQQLIGKRIQNVEYAEIDYLKFENKPSEPFYFTQLENIHSVDFSIFLFTDDDDRIEIFWDDKFVQFEIGVKINEKSNFSGCKHWNLAKHHIWSKVLNFEITSVILGWDEVTIKNKRSEIIKTVYPQDISLTFSNGFKIIISAAQFLKEYDKVVNGMSDNLLVTDNESIAQKTKMIDY